MLEEKRGVVSEVRKQLAKAQKQLHEQVRLYGECKARIEQIESQEDVSVFARLEAELTALVKQQEFFLTQEKEQRALRGTLERHRERLTELQKREREQTEALQQQQEAQARRDAEIAMVKERAPEHIVSERACQEKISALQHELHSMKEAYTRAEDGLQKARDEHTREQTRLAVLSDQIEQGAAELKDIEESFSEAMKRAGFNDEDEFARASHSEEEIQHLRKRVEEFEREEAHLATLIEKRSREVAEREKPNLESINKQVGEWEQKVKNVTEKHTREQTELNRESQILEQVMQLQKTAGKCYEQFQLMEPLSRAANGKNERRLGFQTYVLSFLFQDVLLAANERLHGMTNGRYTLCRSEAIQDRRSQAGLEIEVYDDYTGSHRAASTLSGGEGFLASLSLALGLSDVVQAYAGGIELETLFIDEGFGSLDADALDLAFRSLCDLQKSGRLIGVISHVPELKERIEQRLEILPSPRGSSARFIVPR